MVGRAIRVITHPETLRVSKPCRLVLCAGIGVPGAKKRGRAKQNAGMMVVRPASSLFANCLQPPPGNSTPSSSSSSTATAAIPRGHPSRKAPPLNYTVRGKAPFAELTQGEANRIMEDFEDEMLAPSSKVSKASHFNTWKMFHVRWHGLDVPVLPLTPGNIYCVASQFKAQRYRSFPNYMDTLCDMHKETYPWTDELTRTRKKSVQSTQSGIGPPRQCAEISIAEIHELGLDWQPIATGGPINPALWAILSSFHVTRGAESACALASSVTMSLKELSYQWLLPVSKMDPQATGCSRCWGCVCVEDIPGACPYHAMKTHMAELHKRFAVNGTLPADLPLFPDMTGEWVSRRGFVDTVMELALQTGSPIQDELGRNTVGEHVWRVSGSRHLAALDIPTAIIMRLARWGGPVILRYIADAPLSALTRVYIHKIRSRHNALAAVLAGAAPLPSVDEQRQSNAQSSTDPVPAVSDSEILQSDEEAEAIPPLGWIKHKISGRIHIVLRASGSEQVAQKAFAEDAEILTLCKWNSNPATTCRIFALPNDPKMCTDCLNAQN